MESFGPGLSSPKGERQLVADHRVIELWATGKDVHGCISVFRPCMDSDMGFCDDHHSTDSPGTEFMEEGLNDGASTRFHGLDEGLAHERDFFETFRVAVIEFDQGVQAEPLRVPRRVDGLRWRFHGTLHERGPRARAIELAVWTPRM